MTESTVFWHIVPYHLYKRILQPPFFSIHTVMHAYSPISPAVHAKWVYKQHRLHRSRLNSSSLLCHGLFKADRHVKTLSYLVYVAGSISISLQLRPQRPSAQSPSSWPHKAFWKP